VRVAIDQSTVASEPQTSPGDFDVVFRADDLQPPGSTGLGALAVLRGDEVFDLDHLRALTDGSVEVLVLAPGSESDIQAEAVLEFAIGLSDCVAGLVLIVENDGAEPGEPGHGGSAIVLLGEVLAEAMGGADRIDAEIGVPVPQPVPRDPLPELPTILAQRVAHHQGRHVSVDYPSDV